MNGGDHFSDRDFSPRSRQPYIAAGITLLLLGMMSIGLTYTTVPLQLFLAAFLFVGGLIYLSSGRKSFFPDLAIAGIAGIITACLMTTYLLRGRETPHVLIGLYLLFVGGLAVFGWIVRGMRDTLWEPVSGIVPALFGILIVARTAAGNETMYGWSIGLQLLLAGIALIRIV